MRGQECRQPRVGRGHGRLGRRVAEAGRVAGQQSAGQQGCGHRPAAPADAGQQAGRQRPACQHRAERQHDGELPRVQVGRVGQRARHVRDHVDDHRDEQDLADHVGPAEEVPCHPHHGPGDEGHPRQVQQREGQRRGRPLRLGPEQREQPLPGHPGVLRPGMHGRQLIGHRMQEEAPAGPEQPADHRGQALGEQGRHGQGQLVPMCAQAGPHPSRAAPLLGEVAGDAHRAHRHQRDDPHHQHQRIRDQHPRQQQPDDDRYQPAWLKPLEPVDDQPGQHERHGRADVAERQQQDEDADAELWGEHEASRQQHPQPGFTTGYLARADAAAGQQHGEHDHERVGHRRRDVGGVGVQPEETFQREVLRQFGGVERDVRQVPAVQQHISVQHVPGHQQVVRLVGVLRVRAGHLQVRDEKQRHGQHGRRGGEQAAGRHPAGRPGRLRRLGVTAGCRGGQRGRPLRRPASRHGSHHVLRARCHRR